MDEVPQHGSGKRNGKRKGLASFACVETPGEEAVGGGGATSVRGQRSTGEGLGAQQEHQDLGQVTAAGASASAPSLVCTPAPKRRRCSTGLDERRHKLSQDIGNARRAVEQRDSENNRQRLQDAIEKKAEYLAERSSSRQP